VAYYMPKFVSDIAMFVLKRDVKLQLTCQNGIAANGYPSKY